MGEDLKPFFISKNLWKRVDKPTKKLIRNNANVLHIKKIVVYKQDSNDIYEIDLKYKKPQVTKINEDKS